MNLSSTQKTILGIFTFLPFILAPYIFIQVFHFVIDMVEQSKFDEPDLSVIFEGIAAFIFPVIFLTLISIALFVIYVIHAITNKSIETAERIVWLIIFIFIGAIGFAIYWFMRIWSSNAPPPVTQTR